MVDPVTTNKSLATPPNAADPGTWDQPVNNNAHALDLALGGLTTLNAQGVSGNVVLTLAQYTPANIVVTGVPGAVTYLLPTGVGGFYFVQNNTTGAGSVTFGSQSGGGTVTIPQGDGAVITIDPVYGARRADSIDTEAVGPPGSIQYANPTTGNFAGDAGLVYAPSTQGVTVGGPLSVGGNLQVIGQTVGRNTHAGSVMTTPVVVAFAGTGMSVDCSLSNVFTTTLTGNITGAPSLINGGDGQTINWRLQQDGTGNRTISWPANFRWPSGTVQALSTPANSVDLLVASFFASSGTWLANLIKGFA